MQSLEYQLRTLLSSRTLKVLNVKELTDGFALSNFRKKFSNVEKNLLFCRLDDVAKESVEIPCYGIDIDENETIHKIFYCEVAVGNAYFVSKEYALSFKPPVGFDTFVIGKYKEMDRVWEYGAIEEYSYVIKDRNRIVPLYEVEFEYDIELEKKFGDGNCESCLKEKSIMFCLAERAGFCKNCDDKIHCTPLFLRHKRIYFDKVGENSFINCPSHEDTIVDFFCKECQIPICTQCRLSGDHSYYPNINHTLFTYLEACNELKKEINIKDFESKEEKIENEIKEFKAEIEKLNNNNKKVRSQIDDEYKAIINELNLEISKRYQIFIPKYLNLLKYKKSMIKTKEQLKEINSAEIIKNIKVIKDVQSQEYPKKPNIIHQEIHLSGRLGLNNNKENKEERKTKKDRMRKSTDFFVESTCEIKK
ncbi:B-box zinc finger protein [Spraguea lophii 42_110]|uniref:B-box zinc finger protein n=1 Tax=Spraguea lophii (strain 42_110) TaxID=1358809 RepID=S7W5E8_SPRLO|nr:B-box zinc finger protein [Spraguea lophii 42_110]